MFVKVFLDTNVLLSGFAAFIHGQTLPVYMTDPVTRRHTFEKCIFEAYMAFRGVGGKKPDEGRGRWAEQNLKAETHPSPVSKLTSKFHGGNPALAFYWINQILEAQYGLDTYAEKIAYYVKQEDWEKAYSNVESLKQLADERYKFEVLCNKFNDFLQTNSVTQSFYCEVFDYKKGAGRIVSPAALDGFARDTVFPSEDFEIVYAALTLEADIFLTNDGRLRTCAMSLGNNYPLHGTRFCSTKEYAERVEELLEIRNQTSDAKTIRKIFAEYAVPEDTE